MVSSWPAQGYSCPPSSPHTCFNKSCQSSPTKTKLPWASAQFQPTEQRGMYTDELTLHRNPGQKPTFRSKTSQRPQGQRKNHGETSRDTHIGKLTTEDPCAMYYKGSYMSPSAHCKTIKLVSLKKMLQFSSVAQSCPTLCDPMNRSTPGLPVHHQLPEFTQTHVHRVTDAIQPSHSLSSPSFPAPNPSQHQSLFQWVNSSHEVAKVLEFQL